MNEPLITFRTAKLAKEKGFNIESHNWYDQTETLNPTKGVRGSMCYTNEGYAPPQSLLQKWLREEHNIDVWAQPFVEGYRTDNFELYLPDESYSYFLFKDGVWATDEVDFIDFEEALEEGLYQALLLIKDNK